MGAKKTAGSDDMSVQVQHADVKEMSRANKSRI